MRIKFKLATVLVTSLAAVSCAPPTVPDVEPPKLNFDIPKVDSEFAFSTEANENTVAFTDRIENQDTEIVDCEGKVTNRFRGPVRSFEESILIPPPDELTMPVQFVEVGVPRTLSMKRITAGESAQQTITEFGFLRETKASFRGEVNLAVTDFSRVWTGQTLFGDGKNLVVIKYYGNCLKEEENLSTCNRPQLLATRELIVDLKISRPEAPGVLRRTICGFENGAK